MSRKRAGVGAGIVLAGIFVFAGARLAESGTVLLNPFPWDRPEISRSQGEQLALRQAPGGPVLQSVLAEVVKTNTGAKQPRLCWVVSLPGSLISSHGPPGSIPRRASFYLVLIDARSGYFLYGTAGG